MRSAQLALLLVIVAAQPTAAQLYSQLDLMGDQVRVTRNNMEFSPRLTVGFENENVGTRLRYWHLDADINLSAPAPGYIDDRFHFDVVDWDVYEQINGLRFFGGLRAGYLNFDSTSSPAVNAGAIVPGQALPYYRVGEGDYNGNNLNYAYDFYYPAYFSPDHTTVGSNGIRSAIFGPTAGLEGDVPIIANLWVNYGARMSLLLANWYTRDSYVNTSYYYGYPEIVAARQGSGARFADTLFVPEIFTGLELRWTHAQLGVKFEVQKWQSDQENYSFQSPTIVGIGGTLSARF